MNVWAFSILIVSVTLFAAYVVIGSIYSYELVREFIMMYVFDRKARSHYKKALEQGRSVGFYTIPIGTEGQLLGVSGTYFIRSFPRDEGYPPFDIILCTADYTYDVVISEVMYPYIIDSLLKYRREL